MSESGTFREDGSLDPARGIIATCFGKKRSGKSVMGRLLFAGYPHDRVVISASHDDGPFVDPEHDVFELKGDVETLPELWPEDLRREGRRMTLRYEPDTGSPTALEDVDAVLGMVRRHGHCAVLIHEVALVAPSGRVPAHMRRLLNTNRHDAVTMILCGPRPVTVDPLVIAQSDLVYVFELPVPADRQRVAETVGWKPAEFDEAVEELGPHEYLRFDANMPKPAEGREDMRLVLCPALPADVVKQVER